MNINKNEWNFKKLVGAIQQIHVELAANASRAVNVSLTLRNWVIGCYIAEYELNGVDRARYGEGLLRELANSLIKLGVSNSNRRQLYDYIKFYRTYPQIVSTLSAQLDSSLPLLVKGHVKKVPTVSAQLSLLAEKLINQLPYSMFKMLSDLDDDTKRHFYELECVRGNWSVRELKRQINSLYYERSGLSRNKNKLTELAQQKAETMKPSLEIRDPYIFEFLGLTSEEVMSESHLENRLINKIEKFLLELGHGFCFEARQKRILIGEEHFFIDLVFYNRILKCHVLAELKLEKFTHENIGQLNTYVSWYKKNMMTPGDNPPIGILLCTDKNHALAEYALGGMDNNLFISKYLLELPKKEDMQKFIEMQLKEASPKSDHPEE
ncbi:MAG: cytoplasmic protein [Coxiella sp. RIFCSPHIGHO2_12_FULL_42_15]|nr:MAG: cytoplasmic protein [Coxiella sp. RIFCSPHIGHO2_12_FULL_42_15]